MYECEFSVCLKSFETTFKINNNKNNHLCHWPVALLTCVYIIDCICIFFPGLFPLWKRKTVVGTKDSGTKGSWKFCWEPGFVHLQMLKQQGASKNKTSPERHCAHARVTRVKNRVSSVRSPSVSLDAVTSYVTSRRYVTARSLSASL